MIEIITSQHESPLITDNRRSHTIKSLPRDSDCSTQSLSLLYHANSNTFLRYTNTYMDTWYAYDAERALYSSNTCRVVRYGRYCTRYHKTHYYGRYHIRRWNNNYIIIVVHPKTHHSGPKH